MHVKKKQNAANSFMYFIYNAMNEKKTWIVLYYWKEDNREEEKKIHHSILYLL